MPLRNDIKKVLVIGSGPIVIGQAAEFDYAGTQACLALKEEGMEVVLVNSNPATIMTDETVADQIYIEPLTVESVEKIIAKERPDGYIGTLGGQTGLNLTIELEEKGILAKYGVALLGSSVETIQKGEDRHQFRQCMFDIQEPVPESEIVHDVQEGIDFAHQIGFPVILRPAYMLGGEGGGVAHDEGQLAQLLQRGLRLSPIRQVLVEKSIHGWKEIEYEVMRDHNDTCLTVCNMENMDPVGVHTGDSIVVAPSQTLTDRQYQMLRRASLKVIRALNVIGGCNIQFALDPHSEQYYIIEVNPRVSRSSALASKATGYPIATMATKCALGYHLHELYNPVTGTTYASFEPALDYIVLKLPRFPFDKFKEADRTLGTQMKATGEVMAIDRSFEGALNKAIRSLESNRHGLDGTLFQSWTVEALKKELTSAHDDRLFAIAEAFRKGVSVQQIELWTHIDPWFLYKIQSLIEWEQKLTSYAWEKLPDVLFIQAKQLQMADAYLAKLFHIEEKEVRRKGQQLDQRPVYKCVDTCAAEFDAVTPYYYSTWRGIDEVEVSDRPKILVIGSGPIRIGQGIEFDYCSVHAARAVQQKGYEAVVINNNPETVSTDYTVADKLYFEPLAIEDIVHVARKEQVEGVLVQFGGQTAINVAQAVEDEGFPVLGTSLSSIDALEDRQAFYDVCHKLNVAHIEGETVEHTDQLKKMAQRLGYPVLVRPSYVIGGQSMFVLRSDQELNQYVEQLQSTSEDRIWPLLIDKYLPGKEVEIDVICDGKNVVVPGIFEHIEKAGVHSGDSISILPSMTVEEEMKEQMVHVAQSLVQELAITGLMNIQFVIHEGQLYVLEVNPRASRTVPVVSKVTGIPMVTWAVYAQLGQSLDELIKGELDGKTGLLPEPAFYTVKAPVFSHGKFPDVDDALGPEMKSTGEQLGIGQSLQEALYKGVFQSGQHPFIPIQGQEEMDRSAILCSVAEGDKKEALPVLTDLQQKGFQLLATKGTAQFLQEYGLNVIALDKDVHLLEKVLRQNDVQAVLNIASQGRNKNKFGFQMRMLARKHHIPCFTSLDTVKMALTLDEHIQWDVYSLKNLHLERVMTDA